MFKQSFKSVFQITALTIASVGVQSLEFTLPSGFNLSSFSAFAASPSSSLKKAQSLYRDGKLPEASNTLLNHVLGKNNLRKLSKLQRVDAWRLYGVCQFLLGSRNKARSAFKNAFALNPKTKLKRSERIYSKVVSFYGNEQAAYLKEYEKQQQARKKKAQQDKKKKLALQKKKNIEKKKLAEKKALEKRKAEEQKQKELELEKQREELRVKEEIKKESMPMAQDTVEESKPVVADIQFGVLNYMPFGVPQFKEKRIFWGSFFATAQLTSLGFMMRNIADKKSFEDDNNNLRSNGTSLDEDYIVSRNQTSDNIIAISGVFFGAFWAASVVESYFYEKTKQKQNAWKVTPEAQLVGNNRFGLNLKYSF